MRRVNDELEGMERFIHFLWWILHARWTSPRDKLPTWLNASWWARKVSRGGKRESLAWQRLSYKLIQIFEVACFNSLLYLVPTIPLYSNLWENESEFTKLSWFSLIYIYIDKTKRNICQSLMIHGNLFHLETYIYN